MFKKRNVKASTRRRQASEDVEDVPQATANPNSDEEVEENTLAIEDLMALRKLRKSRQGIDATKLTQGEQKKRRHKVEDEEEEPQYGLQKAKAGNEVPDDDEMDGEEAKTRKLVRSNNFTQQTNKLDVDKHMMAYIEESIRAMKGESSSDAQKPGEEVYDPHAELYKIDAKYKIDKQHMEEGNVTNSMAMLTAIPEVDLGMDVRMRNIEETEKAKRQVADEKVIRKTHPKDDDESHLSSARFFRPNQQTPNNPEALKNARREAMGIAAEREPRRQRDDRKEMATDDVVMERFKKRMRR